MIESKSAILEFLEGLDEEKKYFHFNNDKIINAELIVTRKENNKIIGLTGIYRMYGMPTFFIVVNKNYHGKGIGKGLMTELKEEINSFKYNYVILTVHIENKNAIHLYEKNGYKKLGIVSEVLYMILPVNYTGKLMYFVLAASFPLIRIIRKRKHNK